MTFQHLLEHIADGDCPGIQFTRQKINPNVVFSQLYNVGPLECQRYGQEHRN